MMVVLGREDCLDRFWNVAGEMRARGFDMELETYATVSGKFFKRKMVKEVVSLYEFAMKSKNKPLVTDTIYLLKKIVVDEVLDLFFPGVVKVFTENGNQATETMVNAVFKSLASVGWFEMCNEILKIMEDSGFVCGSNLHSKIVFQLGSRENQKEANESMKNVATSVENANLKLWKALIEGRNASGDLEKASCCFQHMVEEKGGSAVAAAALNSLIDRYCNRKRPADAYQLLCDCVMKSELKPSHVTYKFLRNKLLDDGDFHNALNLLGVIKNHGYPPFLDPLFHHTSRKGNGDSATTFMKAVTSKKFPSTSVFLQMFEAFFKANRHSEAQDFLSRCPRHIRDHADILNLFCSKSRRKVAGKPAAIEA